MVEVKSFATAGPGQTMERDDSTQLPVYALRDGCVPKVCSMAAIRRRAHMVHQCPSDGAGWAYGGGGVARVSQRFGRTSTRHAIEGLRQIRRSSTSMHMALQMTPSSTSNLLPSICVCGEWLVAPCHFHVGRQAWCPVFGVVQHRIHLHNWFATFFREARTVQELKYHERTWFYV